MAQSWQLDRLRLLGVRAEPAEPRPGDPVTFSSLVYAPADVQVQAVTWIACLPTTATDFGCSVDPDALAAIQGVDPSTLTPEELTKLVATLQAAGVIGIEPYLAPTWIAPAESLDGLDDQQAGEGVSAFLTISVVPVGAKDDSDAEIALKRLPISDAETPNHNPDLLALEIDGVQAPDGARIEIAANHKVTLGAVYAEGAVEDYDYLDTDGQVESRTEEPYLTWYTEGDATFSQVYGLYPDTETDYTAPKDPGEYAVKAVVRDRRGGMGWIGVTIVVP